MEVREKLVALQLQADIADNVSENTTQHREFIADFMMANGVTVQEWIPANEPPEDWKGEGGYLTSYYVYTPEYGVDIGNYMKAANRWLCRGLPCNVTHWMPLPEPPK